MPSRPEWQNRLTKEALRGLTPLIYGHINPYGVSQLNMDTRIPIEQIAAA
ncbi:MAG: transposase [Oscillochloris sp.]|nr:transposase [Oscillochloris sp.]